MSAEFKRGDLAIISLFADRAHGPARLAKDGWRCLDDNYLHRAGDVLDARPLVVIDPEDREQVERFREIASRWADQVPYSDMHEPGDLDHTDAMQAALREFANPRPEEPTDPKARVTDRRENVWRLLADGDWVCTDGPDIGEYLVWWQLAERGPLTVEGVTA